MGVELTEKKTMGRQEKKRIICMKCGYGEFFTILRPVNSKEVNLMEWDPLVCPMGCRGISTPIMVYSDPNSVEQMEINGKYWRELCKFEDMKQEMERRIKHPGLKALQAEFKL